MGYIKTEVPLMSKVGEECKGRIYSKEIIEKSTSEWMKSPSDGCITIRPDKGATVEEKLTIDPTKVVGKVIDADFDKGEACVLLDDAMLPASDIEKIHQGTRPMGLRYVGRYPRDIHSILY